ncbi:putative phage protein (predicted DNA packaging) [Pullulanibacillus pueri]|uniref:Phage gp6-like head-tail connector protein n=1 Tax=Pullulanibacillus pueri TaxID=1437324 RepID=A0A8J3EMJ7_9BACL|nr:head-tail connector protein [Pullulanibacillus pueri]MBM7681951.1 putative phage protein (predicted DNA packaging) [Pullulanibacillus pueri]GGH83568.1 hypothetical protein GCM10007096_24630 [Pullulanibacillus pueri]
MDLQEVKNFLRVDSTADDALINSLIKSSDQYLKGAGCDSTANLELYEQAQKILITHWYQNRTAALVGTMSHLVDFSLQSIILSLKSFKSGMSTTDQEG